VDVPALLVEVTQTWEAAAAVEAARVMVVLVVETSAQEAAMVWDSIALCVKDVEDQSTLAEGVALEKVSGVEAENATTLDLLVRMPKAFSGRPPSFRVSL
jgi:hypothetical protein